jgi:cardiolipin synthase A/B
MYSDYLAEFARGNEHLSQFQLLAGNEIICYTDGEEAYRQMLFAIARAERFVGLGTYQFDYDEVGIRFIEALVAASERGAEVRVLIDHLGARLHPPTVERDLARRGIGISLWPSRRPGSSLRSGRYHRKLLIIDDRVSFTGGMNIRKQHITRGLVPWELQDAHFSLMGPVSGQLREVFLHDWRCETGEALGANLSSRYEKSGDVHMRTIVAGGKEKQSIRAMFLAALRAAQETVRIVTPYFVPDLEIREALGAAAMRGVDVMIIVPERNIPVMRGASVYALERLVNLGCRAFMTPPPLDHSKIMLMDRQWVFIGSSNWDSLSLVRNFELNVECYSRQFCEVMSRIVEAKRSGAAELSKSDVRRRSLGSRISNRMSAMLAPFL